MKKRVMSRNYTIQIGLLGMHYFDWAIIGTYNKTLPKYFITTYERLYGIVQISVRTRHSLDKIVVDVRKDINDPSKYSIRKGTIELAHTSDFETALKYFK